MAINSNVIMKARLNLNINSNISFPSISISFPRNIISKTKYVLSMQLELLVLIKTRAFLNYLPSKL